MSDWTELFVPTTPLQEIFVRGTVMFLGIFVMMRLAGQREAGVHSLSDLLLVVLIAEAASHGLAGKATGIADSALLISTIIGWSVAIDAAAYHSPALRALLLSRPSPLIKDGKVNDRALRREFMHREDLMAELRLHGVTDPGEVARAYLETNGMVSVIRAESQDQPAEVDEPEKPRAAG